MSRRHALGNFYREHYAAMNYVPPSKVPLPCEKLDLASGRRAHGVASYWFFGCSSCGAGGAFDDLASALHAIAKHNAKVTP